MTGIYTKPMSWIYQQKPRAKLVTFYFPILMIIGFLVLKVRWNYFYISIVQEDALVEDAQFFAYSAASILAFLAGLYCLKRGALLNGFILFTFALLLTFVSLEEISWGQRLFRVNTPEWFQQNSTQNETNLHNLEPVQNMLHPLYILVGAVFSLGWIPAKHLSSRRRLRRDVKTTLLLFSPRWYLVLFFLPTTLIYSYFFLLMDNAQRTASLFGIWAVHISNFVIWRDQEPAELLLALGFLLFVTTIMLRLKYSTNDMLHCAASDGG